MKRFLLISSALMFGLAGAAPAAARQFDVAALFDRADANGDGQVTRAEYAAARRAMFDRLDRNGDGVVSRADLGRFARRRPQAAERLDAFIAMGDADRDGRLTREEFTAAPTPMFDHADRDGDGVVSRAEREQLRAELEALRR